MKSRFLNFFVGFSIFFLFVSCLIASYLGFHNDDIDVSVPVPVPVLRVPVPVSVPVPVPRVPVPGGIRDVPANEISGKFESLARFAVDEHNKNENALLKFARVVKAKTQVVAGVMYYLTLEVTHESGNKKIYEAKVWEKSRMEFELLGFKPAITPSVLDCKNGLVLC